MAEPDDQIVTTSPDFGLLVGAIVEELYDPKKVLRAERAVRNGVAEGQTVANAADYAATNKLLGDESGLKKTLEELFGWISAWFLSAVVENTFDVPVDNSAFARLGATRGRKAVAKAITDKMVEGLTGGSTSVEPSPDPAARYLAVVFGQVFESWALGEMVEILTAAFPKVDKIEHIADLGDKLVNAMGISDSSSRVLRPYIDTLVVEPLRRHIALTYRPELLPPATVIRQWLRGRWDWADVEKELGLQGLDATRIDALINEQEKSLTVADVNQLLTRGELDGVQARKALTDQGYGTELADLALRVEGTKRIEAHENAIAAAAIGAYAAGDIDKAEFSAIVEGSITPPAERALVSELGEVRRAVNRRRLTSEQAARCVKAKVLAIPDYRRVLEREGYPPEEVIALELLLETELNAQLDVEKARAEKEDQARRAAQAKADADARKQADAERAAALARRGPISELVRAAARGLIPISRAEEVLAALYDADTVAIYTADIEQQRAAYLAQQQKAADATKAATLRHIDVGALEQAVLEGVLTLDQFRRQLDTLEFAPADADILTATLAAKAADRAAAEQKRADADRRAQQKSIDLSRFEALVRRGVRSLEDYTALLASLGFDETSRAAMRELLELQIADDEKARATRAATTKADAARGLSLEQARTAVIIGVSSIDDFQRWLIQNKYAVDAQAVLVAELRDDLAQADAARRAREAADARVDARTGLSTVRRAAQLGIVPVDVYQDRLAAAGYTDDDIAIETELLVREIADVQAARAKQAAADAKTPAPAGLSLAQLAAAVKVGVKRLEDYRARAITLGLSGPDVDTLVRVLAEELAGTTAAAARRAAIESDADVKGFSLAALADDVRAGSLPLDAYAGALVGAGLDPADVDLLVALLGDELAGGGIVRG